MSEEVRASLHTGHRPKRAYIAIGGSWYVASECQPHNGHPVWEITNGPFLSRLGATIALRDLENIDEIIHPK